MELGQWTLLVREERAEPLSVSCGPGTATVLTRPAPHRERPEQNEDGALVLGLGRSAGLLAVADGVGGGPSGGEATRRALDCLARTVTDGVYRREPLRVAILDGLEKAQDAVREVGGGAATTIIVVGIDDDRIRPFHAGDSEAMLIGQRGRVKHRTLSHAPVAYAVESGLLEEDEALVHEERHVVTNALGLPEARIEMGPRLRLAPRDTLLLATDGVTDNLRQEEIVETIRTGPAERAAGRLAERARRRMLREEDPAKPGKPDDLTFLIWRSA